MPLDELQDQHHIWNHRQHAPPELLSIEGRLWVLIMFLIVSVLCVAYVFWIVVQKERKEQKTK